MDLEAGAKKSAKRKSVKRNKKRSVQRKASAKRGAAKRSAGRHVAVLGMNKNRSPAYLGTNLSQDAFFKKINLLEKKSKGIQNSKYMKQRQAMLLALLEERK